MKKENILMGTLILSASSIFVRMIGFVFKVWLSNTMGAEGTGVYSLIMSLYMVCATLATSGISSGVAKLAAYEFSQGKEANARLILRRSLTLSLTLSTAVGVLLFVFAEYVGMYVLRDERTILSLRLLAPGLPFMSVAGCLRGYFIAKRRMGNPAVSQIVEQLVKIAFIVGTIGYFLPRGIEYGSAIVIAGITIGEVVCFFISWIGYLWDKKRGSRQRKADISGVTKSILYFALPISAGSYVRSGMRLWEDVLILSGLTAFSGESNIATGTYGILRGMVMPLLIFPLSLLSAFVMTLTPEISRLSGPQNREILQSTITKILQVTFIIAIFIVAVLMTFAYEMGVLIYNSSEVGRILMLLSWLGPFMSIEMVVVSILQGLGEQVSSMRYTITDCMIRVAIAYLLIPHMGVGGFVIMVIVSNLYTSILNLRRLLRITSLSLKFNDWVVKPVLAALAATQLARLASTYQIFSTLPLWGAITIGSLMIAFTYIVVLLSVGSVALSDFAWVIRRVKTSTRQPSATAEKVL